MVNSDHFALLKKADGNILVGIGPFEEVASCPSSGVAFYVNDFALSESKPWKVPSEVREYDSLNGCLNGSGELKFESGELEIEWSELLPSGFSEVFREINQSIHKGEIEKSVPVATEQGKVLKGSGEFLLSSLNESSEEFFPYAYVNEGSGFCGQTPELLFNLRKGRLNTMALAGTARAEERDVFACDEKEIREHEFVAQTLVSKLSDIGMVTKSERNILNLGSLVHFHTPIEVFLYGDKNVDELIKRLHPTPALGPLPRTGETLDRLIEWRSRLDCPPYFGAPFGVLQDGVFHAVVAIRGVHWEGENISIPSGCGVIEASRLVNEWRELSLKRSAVKQTFGL